MESLPCFPLVGHVLLADAPVPYRLFEERYLAMAKDLATQTEPSLWIPSVESPAEPEGPFATIATRARVVALKELDDGQFLMVVLGEGRSRIQEVDSDKPYRQATGEDFPLPWDCSPAALATALVELSSRFHAVMVERGVAQEQLREWVDQVDEPLALLNRLAHLCLGSPGERQGYLEAASVTARLHLLQKHLGLGPRPSFN